MKTGDSVYVESVDETWLVATVENGYVGCVGWPYTLVKEEDCSVLKSCSEESRIKLLKEMADMRDGYDPRCSYARRILNALDHK